MTTVINAFITGAIQRAGIIALGGTPTPILLEPETQT